MIKVCISLAITLIVLMLACGSDPESTATVPPETPEPIERLTPTATATKESPPTVAPTKESLPTAVPTPKKTRRYPRSPGEDAPFIPTYSRSDRMKAVFEMLIPSEQECVREAMGVDPLDLPFIQQPIDSHDPYDSIEEQFMNAMFVLCPSEKGHRQRTFDSYMRSAKEQGLHLSAEERACVREEINLVPITGGRIELEGELPRGMFDCVSDAFLLWWVRVVGSSLEEVHPNSLNPVVGGLHNGSSR